MGVDKSDNFGKRSRPEAVGQGTDVIYMCPREGVQRYGTVAQVHGSWGCVRLRHNDRRWVLLDQLLPRGSLPISAEEQSRLDTADDSDMESESDGPPTCPPTPTRSAEAEAPEPAPAPAPAPEPAPAPPPSPIAEGDDSDFDDDCEVCPVAAAVAAARPAPQREAKAAPPPADDSDMEEEEATQPSPSPSQRPSPRPLPEASQVTPMEVEPQPQPEPEPEPELPEVLVLDDDDDDSAKGKWGCSRCRWREKGCNAKRCRPKPGAGGAQAARMAANGQAPQAPHAPPAPQSPIAKKKREKEKKEKKKKADSNARPVLVDPNPEPEPEPEPPEAEGETEAFQPSDGDDAEEEPPAEQDQEHEVVDTMTTDYQAERIVFNRALIKQRQACLKRIRPEKFPFFRARHVDTPIRPIETDALLDVPHGEVGYEQVLKFVSEHHHSEELRQSAADTLFIALTARTPTNQFGGLESYLAYAAAAGKTRAWAKWCEHMTEEVFLCRFLYCKEAHRKTIEKFMTNMWEVARGIARDLDMPVAPEEA